MSVATIVLMNGFWTRAVMGLLNWTGLRWKSLRSLGNSRLIRTSFLWFFFVPIVARLLGNFPSELTIEVFNTTLTIPVGLPFRWKLFYFMSLSFAVAQAIYLLRCPPIIKNYTNFTDYQKHHRGMYSISASLVIYKEADPSDFLPSLISGIDMKIGGAVSASSHELYSLVRNSPESMQGDLFDALTEYLSTQRKAAILLSACFFALGGIFFAILSVQSFWTVIMTL